MNTTCLVGASCIHVCAVCHGPQTGTNMESTWSSWVAIAALVDVAFCTPGAPDDVLFCVMTFVVHHHTSAQTHVTLLHAAIS